MRYINTKTGAVLDSPFKVSGGDWVPVSDKTEDLQVNNDNAQEDQKIVADNMELSEVKATEDGPSEIEGVTKKEIMQELEAMGIQYDSRAKKQELYELMIGK